MTHTQYSSTLNTDEREQHLQRLRVISISLGAHDAEASQEASQEALLRQIT